MDDHGVRRARPTRGRHDQGERPGGEDRQDEALPGAPHGQGAMKPTAISSCCTTPGHRRLHERRRGRLVVSGLDHRDRVGDGRLDVVRDGDTGHLGAGGGDIGGVHHGGVGLAAGHRGDGGFDVGGQRLGGDGDAELLLDLAGVVAGGDARGTQHNGHPGLGQVLQAGDLLGVAGRDGDLQLVLGEDDRGFDHAGGDQLVHVRLIGGGEHVGRCALLDLGDQGVGAGEVVGQVETRVLRHERGLGRVERAGQ